MDIRNITTRDFQAILRLNEESVAVLSPLDEPRLRWLVEQAAYHKVILFEKTVAAFIVAFDRFAAYDSPNYLWFEERYSSFLYIDRIVVSKDYRRMGLADALYHEMIAYARQHEYACLTCEIDIVPPNPASLRFHERHHFREVGTQWLYNGQKQVSLQERSISEAS